MSQGELFVELLHEELPASMVRPALQGLRDGLLELIEGIEHGEPRLFATPRRLAVSIPAVAAARPEVERTITGPPAHVAFRDGEPTGAARGFARGNGAAVDDLKVISTDRGEVAAVTVTEGGESTRELVAQGLDAAVRGLPFAKSMVWGEGGVRFGRPLHGVSALYDGEPLQAEAAGLQVGHATVGHRLDELGRFHFRGADDWLEGLRKRRVEPALDLREQRIRELLAEASERVGGDPIDQPDLLEEVLHLVEWPVLVLAEFDEALLELPPRLLVKSMTSHQRYFPIHRDGELTHHFAIISNNPWADEALVAEGNARVLRARFYDARFFFAEDQKRSLEEHGDELSRMRWIRGLGTMADKQARIAALAGELASLVGASEQVARRAGALCKSDLTTQMVGEFPDLQGHMGRLYALGQGEPEAVAEAIEEHYRPAFSGDAVPASPSGTAVALADRLDSLAGCFGIGMTPTGSGDPQGLRRAASGVLAILEEHRLRIDLGDLYRQAVQAFDAAAQGEGFDRWGRPAAQAVADELVEFTLARFQAAAVARGATGDLVEAVAEVTDPDPVLLWAKLEALRALSEGDDFEAILQLFKRVLNITKGFQTPPPDRAALSEPAERALAAAIEGVRDRVDEHAAALDFEQAAEAMLDLREPIAAFFEAVMVDDPDPAIAARRKGLLLEAAAVFRTLADFSRISTR